MFLRYITNFTVFFHRGLLKTSGSLARFGCPSAFRLSKRVSVVRSAFATKARSFHYKLDRFELNASSRHSLLDMALIIGKMFTSTHCYKHCLLGPSRTRWLKTWTPLIPCSACVMLLYVMNNIVFEQRKHRMDKTINEYASKRPPFKIEKRILPRSWKFTIRTQRSTQRYMQAF